MTRKLARNLLIEEEAGEVTAAEIERLDSAVLETQDGVVKSFESINELDQKKIDRIEAERLIASIPTVKGDRGFKGEKGDPGTNGKDGKDGVSIKGDKGDSIIGPAGKDGKDGSPDSGQDIIKKINSDTTSLIKADKVDGFQEVTNKLQEHQTKLMKQVTSLPIWQGVSEMRVKELIKDTPSTPGASAFTDLTDTFSSYSGLAGKGLRVNATETGIDTYTPTDTDEKVKLSATDPTAGYLNDKLAEGVNHIVENEYIDFLEQGSTPTLPANTTGRMWASDTNGKTNLNFVGADGLIQRVNRDLISTVRNTSGSLISRGKLVYQTGSTGTAPNVALAKADSEATLPAIGITMEDIDDNHYGRIQRFGRTEFQLDTRTYTEGQKLWVSPTTAGEFTATQPSHPNIPQPIGQVVVVGLGTGSIFTSFTSYYNEHSDGTIKDTWTFGATTATSQVLAKTATTQRTATFPDKSGTVAFTSDLVDYFKLDQTTPQTTVGTFNFPDLRLTLPGTVNRNITTNLITSVVKTGGRTLTPTRDANGFITSLTDGTKTWTFTRNANNFISSWSIA